MKKTGELDNKRRRWLSGAVGLAFLTVAVGGLPSASAQTAPEFLSFEEERAGAATLGLHFDDSITGFFKFLDVRIGSPIPEFATFRNEAGAAIDGIPIPSGSMSVSYRYDPKLETFVRFEGPLAPALSQRATTNGRRVLTIGTSFSDVRYTQFDDFDRSRVVFSEVAIIGGSGADVTDEFGRPATNVMLFNFKLRQRISAVSLQYGIFDNFDVGVFIPVIYQEFLGRSVQRFFVKNPDGSLQPALVVYDRPLEFANRTGATPLFAVADDRLPAARSIRDVQLPDYNMAPGESALLGDRFRSYDTGLGDVILRTKYFFGSSGPVDFGSILNISLPTGDEDNLLGVGSVRFDPRVVASVARTQFAAHVNGGFHADADSNDRDRADYTVGGELRVTSWMTLLFDQVGRIGVIGDDRIKKFEIVPGVKINPYRDVVVGLNAIVPLNHEGLTTDLTPNATAEASIRF